MSQLRPIPDVPWNRSGRYLAFAGDTHYPSGGWGDLVGRFASMEAALKALIKHNGGGVGWWHIINAETGEVIDQSEPKPIHDGRGPG